jgi:hypothetical protein
VRDAANFQAERVWPVQQLDVESSADLDNDVRAAMVSGFPVLWSEDEP